MGKNALGYLFQTLNKQEKELTKEPQPLHSGEICACIWSFSLQKSQECQ